MCVKGDAQCYIIDHNLAFDREYNDVEFMRNHILRDYYSGIGDAVKRDFFDDVRRCVNDEFLEKTWYLMPSQWLDEEYDKTSVTLDEIKTIIPQEIENGKS